MLALTLSLSDLIRNIVMIIQYHNEDNIFIKWVVRDNPFSNVVKRGKQQ